MFQRDRKKKDEAQDVYDNDHKKWKSDMCPLCKAEREDSAHVLQCTHKRATRFRNRQIKDLHIWFDLQHTDPIISECIINTLSSTPTTTFYETMLSLTDDDEYLEGALSQDTIGRINFGYGRISSHWRKLQRCLLEQEYSKTKFSVDAWAKRLIVKIYKMARNIWRYRCDRVHGADKKKISKRERKAIRKEIKHQYLLGLDNVRVNEKDLLRIPKAEVLKYSTRKQQYWLKTVKASREYREEKNKNMYVGMRDLLRTWAFVPD